MKRFTYLPLLTSLLFLSSSWAEESQPQETSLPVSEERIERRSAALTPEQKLQLKQKRAAEKEDESSNFVKKARLTNHRLESEFMLAPRNALPQVSLANYAYYIPDYTHWLSGVGLNGYTLDMEDGTRWDIHPSDTFRLNSWRLNDPIVISPNYSWCSSGDFYITNQNTNTAVRADLVVSPIAFGPYSHWIVSIDYTNGHVYLENGTTWCMSEGDFFVYRNWAVNDHIIMGYNDSFFSPYDRILINFNMDSYVRAKQY
jgi:hypothetical protein